MPLNISFKSGLLDALPGQQGFTAWSHGDGSIRVRSISSSGDVVLRRIRASANPKFGPGHPGSARTGWGSARNGDSFACAASGRRARLN